MKLVKQLVVTSMFVIVVTACAVEGVYPMGPGSYYEYYYYPTARVYFNLGSGYYHYYLDGSWVRAKTLPPKIRLDSRDRHPLKTKERDPYKRNQDYQTRYKPLPKYNPGRDKDRKEREYNRESFEKYHQRRR